MQIETLSFIYFQSVFLNFVVCVRKMITCYLPILQPILAGTLLQPTV